MMTENWFIRTVDHRISTALIMTLLLVLIGGREKRRGFPLRVALSAVAMCIVSWVIRFAIDTLTVTPVAQGTSYAIHLLVMSLMYMAAYAACYRTNLAELAYVDLMALTVYKLAWNTFKVCATFLTMGGGGQLWSNYSVMGSLVSYVVYVLVCVPTCWLHDRIVSHVPEETSAKPLMVSLVAFLFCQLVLEFSGRVFTADASALFLYYLCALMYTTITYVVLLTITKLNHYRRDNEAMHNFIRNKMQYYQMSRDGITSLQIKCHDLKHQIAAIRTRADWESIDEHIQQLEDTIIEYGTVVECGNEAINIVLTEKNILCSTCGVKFSYIIDGTLFSFMSETEIYSLFGNTLDNALESCSKVSDPEKRVIALKAAQRGDMIVLHVENFFEAELNMVNGMPVTTKKEGGHGFGLRSIQQIAEKYDGVVTVQAEGNIFKITVILKPGSR